MIIQSTSKIRKSNQRNTLSGLLAPEVTPILIGPWGNQFSFSTSSPCYSSNTGLILWVYLKKSRYNYNKKVLVFKINYDVVV